MAEDKDQSQQQPARPPKAHIIGDDPTITPTGYEPPETERTTTCKACAGVIKYTAYDTYATHDYTGDRNAYDAIECPRCKAGITVKPYPGYVRK